MKFIVKCTILYSYEVETGTKGQSINMKGFRKVNVAGRVFQWNYHFDCLGYKEPSYLEANLMDDKEAGLRIFFRSVDSPEKKYPLNRGIQVKRGGEDSVLSLNDLNVVDDILFYLLMSGKVDFDVQKKYIFDTGEEILREIGFGI